MKVILEWIFEGVLEGRSAGTFNRFSEKKMAQLKKKHGYVRWNVSGKKSWSKISESTLGGIPEGILKGIAEALPG